MGNRRIVLALLCATFFAGPATGHRLFSVQGGTTQTTEDWEYALCMGSSCDLACASSVTCARGTTGNHLAWAKHIRDHINSNHSPTYSASIGNSNNTLDQTQLILQGPAAFTFWAATGPCAGTCAALSKVGVTQGNAVQITPPADGDVIVYELLHFHGGSPGVPFPRWTSPVAALLLLLAGASLLLRARRTRRARRPA